MELAVVLVVTATAVLLVLVGIGQLSGNPTQLHALDAVNVSPERAPAIAWTQLAGAAGLLAGIWWRPIGVAAAAGVVLLFLMAIGIHLRARNANVLPAVLMLALGVAALVLFLRA